MACGAGLDNEKVFDRLIYEKKKLGPKGNYLYQKANYEVEKLFRELQDEF